MEEDQSNEHLVKIMELSVIGSNKNQMIANNKGTYIEIVNSMLVLITSDRNLYEIHKAENNEADEMKVSFSTKAILNNENADIHSKCE